MSLSTVVLWSGSETETLLFYPSFYATHYVLADFQRTLQVRLSNRVNPGASQRHSDQMSVIIGNELTSCSSVLQEWIHFFTIRLYAGLGIILAKACAVCFNHLDRNMIMNPYLIQIHAR